MRALLLSGWACAMAVAILAAPSDASAACRGWNLQRTITAPEMVDLVDVAVVPRSAQAWAVGSFGRRAAILHFTGRRWTRVPIRELPRGDTLEFQTLYGVHAISASDVWAVGESHGRRDATPEDLEERYTFRFREPLVAHWDGSEWSVVPFPDLRLDEDSRGRLMDVVALAADDVWAVGWIGRAIEDESLVAHWDGAR
jgi:hypothetical protein